MMICSSCGTHNPQGRVYCNACGTRLGEATPIRCPSCGTMHANVSAYCSRCGSPLKNVAPSAPPETLHNEARSAQRDVSTHRVPESGLIARQRLLRLTQRDRLEEKGAPDPTPAPNPHAAGDGEAELDATLFALLRRRLGLAYAEIREVIVRRKDGRSIRLRPPVANPAGTDALTREINLTDVDAVEARASASDKK